LRVQNRPNLTGHDHEGLVDFSAFRVVLLAGFVSEFLEALLRERGAVVHG